ncbi:transglutaminase family protein [Methylosinus sp. Sm6]|uniref:transglutaminase-like domain-containing protein n=1 Tax=Methylosinus sp. Sm6 TaxID=2866948 RepID=UPI001C98FDDD|nr:transglutaminase-like domain-containing protein [Methylosinus sp. Sm6]MBY6243618.1 transglutaminase-like domain-containing protein [Methylosinus sp. Sm6]
MTTSTTRYLQRTLGAVGAAACLNLLASASVEAQVVSESAEIVYSSADAQALRDKARQLGNAAAIYEYVHNTIEHSPYHGSRSGSVNTFLGRRGSDVDIATALIAMLRSRNIPARYAVGTVRLPAAQLTNWLGAPQLDTAVETLKAQGVQRVTLAADRSTVDLEHVWVEAFVSFDQYRGVDVVSPAVDCSQSANAARCTWAPLDASFKQKTYNGLALDPYPAVSFDYTAYYNAIKNKDAARRDKNPLTILEDQIGAWLRANHPGKTLEDVEDAGRIVELREGLLPASLPYQVIGAIRRYDTVAAHDAAVPAAEPKKWGKRLTIDISITLRFEGGGTFTASARGGNALLAELNTKRLTLSTEFQPPGNIPNVVTRLGGVEIARPLSGGGTIVGYTPRIGDPYTIVVGMDGVPGAASGDADRTITASYSGIIGGYYLLATGGESSNWSQVHRAADQLLASNDRYKIVFNPGEAGCRTDGVNCTPYVDANANGWDSSDTKLLENKPALDALTGGLLYVGASQYFAKLREQFERADRLMKTRTPVIGFLGVVSSVYEAEYVDGTAFSILPGGLLIDMKGITIGGSYRTGESGVSYSNRQFEFLGHITSSLEHETWQELTGYDAVSTVRGIQMALASGASLLNVKRDAGSNTLPSFIAAMGFGNAAPSRFAIAQRDVYGTRPTSWSHPTYDITEGFDVLKKAPTGTSDTRLPTLSYYNDYWHSNIGCFDTLEGQLDGLRATYGGSRTLNAGGNCGVYWAAGTTIDQAIAMMKAGYNSYRGGSNAAVFNYLDARQGFVSADFAYRNVALAANAYSTAFVARVRDDLQLRDTAQSWAEYTLPSTLATGATYRFQVDIRKAYDSPTDRLTELTFEIANRSLTAGGGYVGLDSAALAADRRRAD